MEYTEKIKFEMKLGLPYEYVRLFSRLSSDECIRMTFPLLLKALVYKMELICGAVQLLSKIKSFTAFHLTLKLVLLFPYARYL